jgi:hypothetical protein
MVQRAKGNFFSYLPFIHYLYLKLHLSAIKKAKVFCNTIAHDAGNITCLSKPSGFIKLLLAQN